MFALLAMAGDLGGSIGPAIVGRVADMFGGSIHVGMRIGLLFPITLCFMLFLFNIMNHNANKQKGKTNEITCDRYTKRNNR